MPAPSEFELQRAFLYWFNGIPGRLPAAKLPGVVCWHTPNGGARDGAEAKRFKELGVLAGIPDVFMLWGRLFALEFKRPGGGRLSPAQLDLHPRLEAAGAFVRTVDSLDEAKKIVHDWGLCC